MDKQMETIIKRQQEYERLERLPLSVILNRQRNIGVTDDYLAGVAVPEIRKMHHRKRLERNFRIGAFILTILCVVFLVMIMGLMLVCAFLYLGGYFGILYNGLMYV